MVRRNRFDKTTGVAELEVDGGAVLVARRQGGSQVLQALQADDLNVRALKS